MSAVAPSLREIARALAGEVTGGRVRAPGPGHSAKDRSLWVRLSPDAPDGFLAGSFSQADWREAKDFVRARLGMARSESCPREVQPRAPARPLADDEAKGKAQIAAWLWARRKPVSESNAAGLYLRKRGYTGQFPATLGYLPPNGKHPPAMVAAFGFCNELEAGLITPPDSVTGVHLTRLTPEGGKAPIDPVKITLGPSMGLPIVLAPANDGLAIGITEGTEDGLSITEEFGIGVWVAGTAGRMPGLAAALPSYVEVISIFAHRDETGLKYAREAARLISTRGIETHIRAIA